MSDAAPQLGRAETLTGIVDVSSLLVAAAVTCAAAFDARFPGRPVAALLFITWVPGWTALRIARVPVSTLAAAGAFVLSLSMMILTSFLLATRLDWAWRFATVLWALACVLTLLIVLGRRVGDSAPVS